MAQTTTDPSRNLAKTKYEGAIDTSAWDHRITTVER
jgi:hypothetical protein